MVPFPAPSVPVIPIMIIGLVFLALLPDLLNPFLDQDWLKSLHGQQEFLCIVSNHDVVPVFRPNKFFFDRSLVGYT